MANKPKNRTKADRSFDLMCAILYVAITTARDKDAEHHTDDADNALSFIRDCATDY